MDRYLKNNAILIRPLNQYAYEEKYAYVRSTNTTLHHLVSGIEIQLAARKYASGVFINIEELLTAS